MRMPDINVLIYAHRQDMAGHAFYRKWVERIAAGPEPFALSLLATLGFVRVVTHASFPGGPTPLEQALAVVDGLLASPTCVPVSPGPRHWQIVSNLCRATRASGKRVADAQHAAIAIEHGATWITRDDDFALFAPHGLRWQSLTPA